MNFRHLSNTSSLFKVLRLCGRLISSLYEMFPWYAEAPARAIRWVATIAMPIGPDAPISFQSKNKGSHMSHVYDFYKPDLASEYSISFLIFFGFWQNIWLLGSYAFKNTLQFSNLQLFSIVMVKIILASCTLFLSSYAIKDNILIVRVHLHW